MLSREIRRRFLHFFKEKGHALIPSSPVIPLDDPTLLFINAGMNQFKDLFLGKSKRDYTKATTSQKCIRVGGKHNDLENVGHTSRHLTFFEMLGNFSFGDYFKKEAISFAWQVSTEIFGLDPEKIWVSVFETDEEAFSLWESYLPLKRIVRFGEKENFWSMGEVGPCGPCSELLFDRGETYSSAPNPTLDPSGERYLEFWNLVFMQFEKGAEGSLSPLPKPSIDTGAGLERVISLKMGVDSVFQTDILQAIIRSIETVSKKSYDPNKGFAPFHVIADHLRSLSFAIADGVQPSNTDRGYVLRKLLRRAVRYGRTLDLKEPFLAKLFPSLLAEMGEDFPELQQSKERIEEILTLEEEAFLRTLSRGNNLLSEVIVSSKKKGVIQGEDAFRLKDTYGLPLEEIVLIAQDENLKVDLPRFEILEKEAKELSRKSREKTEQRFDENFFAPHLKTHGPSVFQGYDHFHTEGKLLAIVSQGKFVSSLEKGEEGILLFDQTVFYAEMGGQVGDQGVIGKEGNLFSVTTTTSPFPGVIAHIGKVQEGTFALSSSYELAIDRERRRNIQNNHTATHLLHWALEQVVGPHIKQAGSLVDADRLRFDFSHHKPLSKEELVAIERKVNRFIRQATPVSTYERSYQSVQSEKEIKQFFGDKYGEKVRVVDMAPSKELCGGTHAKNTGELGIFKIFKESSIAAGVRRIEGSSGSFAEEWILQEEKTLSILAEQFKTPPTSLEQKGEALLEEISSLKQRVQDLKKELLQMSLPSHLAKQRLIGKTPLIAEEVDLPFDEMALLSEALLSRMGSGIVALGATKEGRCQIVVAVSSDLVAHSISAQEIIKKMAPHIQGGGGGRAHLAQAGGKRPEGIQEAFETLYTLLSSR